MNSSSLCSPPILCGPPTLIRDLVEVVPGRVVMMFAYFAKKGELKLLAFLVGIAFFANLVQSKLIFARSVVVR